jgi:hypothetical protein
VLHNTICLFIISRGRGSVEVSEAYIDFSFRHRVKKFVLNHLYMKQNYPECLEAQPSLIKAHLEVHLL